MKTESDFYAYLKALVETPVSILFALLDVAATIAIIRLVVDDLEELLIVVIFLFVVHGGHYLIFKKQRTAAAELAKRIAELEDSWPKLDLLLLHDGQPSRHMMVTLPKLPRQPDLDELVRREAQELEAEFRRVFKAGNQSSPKAISDALWMALMHRRKDAEQYKKECEDYLQHYRKYCQDLYHYKCFVARLQNLSFRITNSGRVPAEDIIVLIYFPDQFRFPSEWELVEVERSIREPPAPPVRPSPVVSPFVDLAGLSSIRSLGSLVVPPAGILGGGSSNVKGPFITRKSSTEVRYEIANLLHGFEIDLAPVKFLVSEDAIGHVWELEFSIHAGNLPEGIRGSLLLEFQLDEAD